MLVLHDRRDSLERISCSSELAGSVCCLYRLAAMPSVLKAGS